MALTPETERKRLRLAEFDYRSAGFYYVTLCTQGRLCLFGEILNAKMLLNDAGKMIHDVWTNLPNHFPNIQLDSFVIMPNHFHAIVIIKEITDIFREFGTAQRPSPTNASLSDIIRNFKTYTTWSYINGVHENNWAPFEKKLWQRAFYEHIIRNEASLLKIQQYIIDNPLKWKNDKENPDNIIENRLDKDVKK
jgi:putative transposase